MPKKFAIIAVDRAPFRDAELHKRFLDGVKRFSRKGKVKGADWKKFARHVTYQQGDFKDPATYSNLAKSCAKLDKDWKVKAGHIFHLATPPVMVGVIPKMLADAGLNRDRTRARIVVEKPIGHDLDSARELNRIAHGKFPRIADFPHRPLPGQRDGAKHSGVSLRQSALRADLEPALRGLCDHHRGRRGGRRASWRLLRPGGRPARHGAESPDAAPLSRGHGTDGLFQCRRDSQQES